MTSRCSSMRSKVAVAWTRATAVSVGPHRGHCEHGISVHDKSECFSFRSLVALGRSPIGGLSDSFGRSFSGRLVLPSLPFT